MAWNTSGEERVKSYRVYRELEERYERCKEENARLVSQIAAKEELIRSLAAEVARLPVTPINEPVRREAAHAYTETVGPKSVPPPKRSGTYSLVSTGDEELDSIPIPATK